MMGNHFGYPVWSAQGTNRPSTIERRPKVLNPPQRRWPWIISSSTSSLDQLANCSPRFLVLGPELWQIMNTNFFHVCVGSRRSKNFPFEIWSGWISMISSSLLLVRSLRQIILMKHLLSCQSLSVLVYVASRGLVVGLELWTLLKPVFARRPQIAKAT